MRKFFAGERILSLWFWGFDVCGLGYLGYVVGWFGWCGDGSVGEGVGWRVGCGINKTRRQKKNKINKKVNTTEQGGAKIWKFIKNRKIQKMIEQEGGNPNIVDGTVWDYQSDAIQTRLKIEENDVIATQIDVSNCTSLSLWTNTRRENVFQTSNELRYALHWINWADDWQSMNLWKMSRRLKAVFECWA